MQQRKFGFSKVPFRNQKKGRGDKNKGHDNVQNFSTGDLVNLMGLEGRSKKEQRKGSDISSKSRKSQVHSSKEKI